MDFELPQEIRMLKDTMRRFVDRELIPIEMHAMDGPDLKPEIRQELEAKTRELGLWLLEVPAELGGQDLSLLAMAVINEELARTVAVPARGPGIFGPEVPLDPAVALAGAEEALSRSRAARREEHRLRADRARCRRRPRRHAHDRGAPRRPLRDQRLQALHRARKERRLHPARRRDRPRRRARAAA